MSDFTTDATAGPQGSAAPPQSPRIARKRARVRETLRGVGVKLFAAKGLEGVSVEEVIAAAGIARSTFYTFFTSKRDLLAHIVAPVFETGLAALAPLHRLPPRQIMPGIIDAYLTMWERHGEALQLSIRIGKAEFALIQDIHNRFVETLTGLIGVAAEAGLLRNGSAEHTRRLIARTAVEILLVYRNDPGLPRLYRASMTGLLLKDAA